MRFPRTDTCEEAQRAHGTKPCSVPWHPDKCSFNETLSRNRSLANAACATAFPSVSNVWNGTSACCVFDEMHGSVPPTGITCMLKIVHRRHDVLPSNTEEDAGGHAHAGGRWVQPNYSIQTVRDDFVQGKHVCEEYKTLSYWGNR